MSIVESDQVATIIVKDCPASAGLPAGRAVHRDDIPKLRSALHRRQQHVDSLYGDNDFTPFVNLFKRILRQGHNQPKIRCRCKIQGDRGERFATRAPYGYKKD
jgi:hypothetical protein